MLAQSRLSMVWCVNLPLSRHTYVYLSLSVKAVHLEAVSDLTSEAFIVTLWCFVARRGYPTLIWSDNGTNFVVANREIKSYMNFSKN